MTEEEEIRGLIRQMHEKAENTLWPLSAEDIRSQRRRRGLQVPNPKVLVLVTAVIVLVVVLVGTNIGSGGHKSHPVAVPPPSTTTTSAPSSTTTTTNGVPRVTVPELVGKGEAQAESNLANLGLTVGHIDFAPSARAAGIVLSQAPSAGSLLAPGSAVMFTVSSGPSTAVLGCLDPGATTAEPLGGWMPNKGGVLDYNPDSADSAPVEPPSAQAKLMATRFASMSGHHFDVVEAKAARTSHCTVVQWALLHDKTQDSAYLALLRLRRPIDPNSFPLLGASTNRRRLHGGTEVLSSQTSNGGVVTVVATQSDGLTLLLQIGEL